MINKYPFLTLCQVDYLENNFAKRCFDTSMINDKTEVPIVMCCCNESVQNICPKLTYNKRLGRKVNINEVIGNL